MSREVYHRGAAQRSEIGRSGAGGGVFGAGL